MLASAFRSPAPNPALTVSIPGSTFPACRFASCQPLPRPVRPFAPPPTHPVCAGIGDIDAHGPLPLPRPAWPAAFPASTPLRDSYVPPDRSVLPIPLQAGPPSETARFPFAPRRRNLLLVFGFGSSFPSRYCFGGSLFLSTSWNLLHYAPEPVYRQSICAFTKRFSATSFLLEIRTLALEGCRFRVDKTAP
jgi:hypothetical protein